MSEFSHSLHVFGSSEEDITKALDSTQLPAAIVAVQAGVTTLVGGWDLAAPLSIGLRSILEYSYAEDHGFQLRLYGAGELVACFDCPFGEQFDDLDLEDFETDADQERRERTVAAKDFVDHLLSRGMVHPDAAHAALSPLLRLEGAVSGSAFSDATPLHWEAIVGQVAEALGLPAYRWLSEDDVFRDSGSSLDEIAGRYPAFRLFRPNGS